MERQKRKQEIEKGLQFIQSTLPLSQEDYEAFLQKLVRNLFAEGNDLFREKDFKLSLVQYVEGLNVADYAASDEVTIPKDLLCKLHVNRAACYFAMGLYEKALEDCEKALSLDKENIRALFRKARSLNELGRHKEAYECNSRCLLSLSHDESVTQLGQELAQKLGLRVRKAYKRPQQELETFSLLSNGTSINSSNQTTSNGLGSIDDIETDCSMDLQCLPAPVATSIPVSEGLDPLPSDSDAKGLPTSLPAASLLPSPDCVPLPGPENTEDFTDGDIIGEELDSLLDSLAEGSPYPLSLVQGTIPTNLPTEMPQLIPVFPGGTPLLPPVVTASIPVSTPLPPASFGLVMDPTKQLSSSSVLDAFEAPPGGSGSSTLDSLDSLDLLPYTDTRLDALDSFGTSRGSLDTLDSFPIEETSSQELRHPPGSQKPAPVVSELLPRAEVPGCSGAKVNLGGVSHPAVPKATEHLLSQPEPVMPNTALLVKNPLASTHVFKQACHICYPKTGPKAGDYTYREGLEHKCKRDILLGRLKNSEDKTWKRIRPRPTKTNFVGSYYLCKDMLNKQDCKYGDNCTFAYHQEEIDVWTEERKGTLNRDLLFDPLGGIKQSSLTIAKLLKEHQGIFTFLCEICFDSKPRIISKGTKDTPSVCSNLSAKHIFHDNKCLVHIVRSTSLKYSKIRQFQEHFQFDVCRHEVRYGCLREDSCHFAHSFIELKVWLLQQYSGMTHEDIVQESKKYWQQMEAHASKPANNVASPRTPTSSTFDLQMKFVCGQCWRNGQLVEPDKDLKYCSAKAPHCWTKERRVLLVMSKAKKKWVSVRPLPSIRNFPQQYDLCIHAQNGRKCQYVGNCSFAHSPEERDMWTFMKENKILDMQQTYDMWLKKHNPGKPGEGTPLTSREGEKQIQMPTDYADIMMGYHCWLCGKNSNSKKQWQQHIQSEKHKEKVFTSDSDSSCWSYRFPMGEFRLCERFQKNKACPEGEECRYAHGQDELTEWLDRREVLKQKLAKARKDMLLCPRDDDFGKYNFLLRDDV
ncbi:PREDICTED: zinc finger CCCH domain-containing protein 7B isoform X1 [Ficedula albicollis]|uniref:zinc finger CCCH domain-containing protein 7B isoform X1 n=1 Tax=Ficedula albicollis TaxID=59894 RepID=UPI0007AD8AE9|nr:PREDICTED: zinc finger CCCH domain-containing protein 7B isoform X1 [Ficedula albicollis]XP_016161442.1 PREDICTED: zinc finger CCCH domain-containing protein 7B isoform X1 [Ficedula albicollis]XP_016161443.1 PREDICTED: zinc finger CCCH domain-containing protein 7B isoform X1 [Ficedula albicollis]